MQRISRQGALSRRFDERFMREDYFQRDKNSLRTFHFQIPQRVFLDHPQLCHDQFTPPYAHEPKNKPEIPIPQSPNPAP